MANPACMNMTRKPVTSVQVKLMAILFWPTWLATSASVRPALESEAGTSLMVPVSVPPGIAGLQASVVGALPAASLSSAVAARVVELRPAPVPRPVREPQCPAKARSQTGRNMNTLVRSVSLLFAP